MSHYTVLIVGENIEEQLAPFNEQPEGEDRCYLEFTDCTEEVKESWENAEESKREEYGTLEEYAENYYGYKKHLGKYGYWSNPNAKWDWYQVGGRWTGMFKLKEGATGEVGEPGIMTDTAPEGYADSAYKRDIDFEYMRNTAAEKAAALYDKAAPLITKDFKGWTECRELFSNIDEAREFYHSQETIKRKSETEGLLWAEMEDFLCTREEYIQKARNSACTTFAVLKDGEWYERGEMGWWAMVSNEKEDWDREFASLLDSIPNDELLTVVDCHI